MSWLNDTDFIISDSETTVVQVKSVAFDHSSIPAVESATTIETATILVFPERGELLKDERGQIKESTHLLIFSDTSSVAVTNKCYPSGSSNYYDVLQVKDYNGHKEIKAKEVKGR